ncbi:sigma-70 family RNA polymerase sigma factor [Paraburkholderia phytofirmans]|uniref:RNA polymerase sigma factor n=1 Tax=Paraburkholderia phytofirmans TaxID=261302 RepID=A0ABW9BLS2_9BURK
MAEDSVRKHIVDRAVDTLTADYERQDGHLERRQVDRTLEKRGLTVAECQVVLDQLEHAGIRFEDSDEEATTSLQQFAEDREPRDTGGPITLVDPYKLAGAHRNAAELRLLTGPEELALGRAISLGQRASAELEKGDLPTALHEAMITKGLAARSRMTLANLRLVAHVARPFSHMSDLSEEDLIQEGILGLIRAAEKFDHTLGLKFSTYATWWIRQAVTRAIADRGVTIRLPAYLTLEVHRYRRALRLLHNVNPARTPSLTELANELAWPVDRVAFVQHLSALQPTSLEDSIANAPDARLADLVASEEERPDETAERTSLRKAVANAVAELSDNERLVLNLRFGLLDESGGRTLEEVGQEMGVTRERVRQIQAKALKRLISRARRRENHFLLAYWPPGWQPDHEPAGEEGVPREDSGKVDKKKSRKSRQATRLEPQPFPREYRWLR